MDIKNLQDNVKILGVDIRFYKVADGMIVRYEHDGKTYTPPEFTVSATINDTNKIEGERECFRLLEYVIRNAIKTNNVHIQDIDHVAVSYRGNTLSSQSIEKELTDNAEENRLFIFGYFSASIVKKQETIVVLAHPNV